jgi:hypothetical protein
MPSTRKKKVAYGEITEAKKSEMMINYILYLRKGERGSRVWVKRCEINAQWSRNSKSVHFYKKHHIHKSLWIIHEKKDEVPDYIASYSVWLDSV